MNIIDQPNQVKIELFKNLLRQSKATLLLGEAVATIVFIGLLGQVALVPLLSWYTVITLTTVVRLILNVHLKSVNIEQAGKTVLLKHIIHYSAGALVAGVSWASLILLYEPNLPPIVQTFILVITIGMPMAALSTNAILLCSFYSFTLPLLLAILLWPVLLTEQVEIQFLLTAIIYSILVIVTGRRFHVNLRSSITNYMENRRLVDELSELAYMDHLTDLPNRRQFQINAERTLAKVKNSQSSMALMLIDIDNFKAVNDTFGHEAGDELLMELSNRIKHSIRLNDQLAPAESGAARLGGDEFIVMLECEHQAIEVKPAAERILNNLRHSLKVGGIDYIPSVSIGIAIAPEHATNMRTLMSLADQAMYCAKQTGGNSYSIYAEDKKTPCNQSPAPENTAIQG